MGAFAISSEQDQFFGLEATHAFLDHLVARRCDQHHQVDLVVLWASGVDQLAIESAHDVGDRCAHVAGTTSDLVTWEQKLHQLECRRHADDSVELIHHRDAAVSADTHALVDIEEGLVTVGAIDVALADIAYPRAHIYNQTWRRYASLLQHPRGARGDLATARGHRIRYARCLEQLCVTDCGTDRIGVGIAVTDDVGWLDREHDLAS